METTRPHRRRLGLAFEPLEPRFLLSADLVPLDSSLVVDPLPPVPAVYRALQPVDAAPQVAMQFEMPAREVVFVDGSIQDHVRLAADFLRATGGEREIDVVVLDPDRDGIEQIGEALAARRGLVAVHVLSHGADGAVALGDTTLDSAALAARAETIGRWAQAFAADGDILFYGCDLAATASGEAFLAELARLSGADVAASSDLTGSRALGGDWDLEFATGAIEWTMPPLANAIWTGLLATETLDWDGGVAILQPGGAGTAYTTGAVALGSGTVTVTVSGYAHDGTSGAVDNSVLGLLAESTPLIDQAETGGLSPAESSLRLVSTGFEPDDPGDPADAWQGFLITIDFSHAGGVSNAGFSIFDIDQSGGAGFIDELVAVSNQGVPTTTTGGIRNTVVAAGVVRGTGNSPASQAFGNATFGFAQAGITQIQIFYKNAGGQTNQGIGLHDISFQVNDPPAIAAPGPSSYAENDPASVISGGATVTDPDSANFDTGTLTVSFVANGTAADQLAIRNEGTGLGQIGVSGADVTFGGVTIGTFAGGANGTNLVVTFNAAATPAAVQALARNITFANTSEDPSPLARTVRFTVADGDGGSAFADATVNVAAVNDAPVLAGANDPAGVAEDPATNPGTPVSALIAGQVTDVDAGALFGIAVTAADDANGSWQYSTDGGTSWNAFGTPSVAAALLLRDTDLVRFVPNADWNGTATVSFRAWDRTSGAPGGIADTTASGGTTAFATAVATSTIAIAAVGDTVNDAIATDEDNAVAIDVLTNDSFENPGRTLIGVAGAANGTVGFTSLGAVTYTPNADWNGVETLTYTVASGGVTETGTLTITVDAVNDAPALALGASQTVAEDSGAHTVAGFATAAPGGGPDEAGQTFTYAVTNDNNALFTVQPSIAPDGTLTYTLAADTLGTANVLVSVTDSGGTTNGGVATTGPLGFTITATGVADTPSVTNAATLEDLQTAAGLVITRNPADGAEVTHFKITAITGGTLFLDDGATAVAAGSFVTAAQGAAGLRFTPAANSVTPGSFDVQASTAANDAGLGGSVVTATIAVTAVNDEPSFAVAGNQAVAEDSGAHSVGGFATAAPGGGPDEAIQTFAYTVTNDNNALFTVQPSIAPNGTLTYTLAPDASGAATVTLVVTDSGGTLNGGDDASPAQTFTIAVTPVADAPSLTVNLAAGNEDTAIPLAVAASLVDTDGSETLALGVSAIPIGATLSDGTASFTAAAGSQTVDVTAWNLATLSVLPPAHSDADFNLTVSATSTEAANGFSATVSASLAVTVDPVADAPTLVVAPTAGNEDTAIALAIGVALVDTDGSESLALELDALPVGVVLGDGINSFTATAGNQLVDLTGWNLAALTVTPPTNGDADFPLTVRAISSEAGGGTATSVANVNVDVLPVNDAPTVAAPAAIGVVEDVASPVTGIVFGDVDAGGNPVTATFTVAQGALSAVPGGGVAVGGTATALTLTGTVVDINAFIAAGNLRYATALNDTTPVALTASLDDLGNTGAGGALASPGANVTLNVTPVDDAPVFGNLTLSVSPGGTVVLTSANLSATDVDDAWAGLVFFIGNLQNGFFELAGNPGVAVTSFTQGQVGAGAVRFVQTTPFLAPSYVVFVTDGNSVVGPAAVALTFQPAIGVLPAPAAGLGAATLPTVSFAATSLGTASDDPGGPFGIRFVRAPLVPIAGGGGTTTVAEENRAPTTAGARQALKTLATVTDPGLGFAGDRLPTSVPQLDFTIRPARHGDEPHGFAFSLDSVRSAGIALSVGAAWWAGRASGLLSSLLASTPTWRHVDPLPVLGRNRDDEPIGWGEPDAEEEKQEEAAAGEMFGREDYDSRA